MNLDKLTSFAISVVLSAALVGNLDRLQLWILKSKAKLLYESRASNWGNPSVFKAIEAKDFRPRN